MLTCKLTCTRDLDTALSVWAECKGSPARLLACLTAAYEMLAGGTHNSLSGLHIWSGCGCSKAVGGTGQYAPAHATQFAGPAYGRGWRGCKPTHAPIRVLISPLRETLCTGPQATCVPLRCSVAAADDRRLTALGLVRLQEKVCMCVDLVAACGCCAWALHARPSCLVLR